MKQKTRAKPAKPRPAAKPVRLAAGTTVSFTVESSRCDCCAVVAAAASGSIFFAEDGTLAVLEPPVVPSYLAYDPRQTPPWYWAPL